MRAVIASACLLSFVMVAACTDRPSASGETGAAACNNGADDDGDRKVDCADPDCTGFGLGCGGSADAGGLTDGGIPLDGEQRDGSRGGGCTKPIDLVFVMDVSTSMTNEMEKMRMGIEAIWNAANERNPDTQFGLIVFVDDALAVNGCAPAASLTDLQAQFAHWRDECSSNRSPVSDATNYDCAENSLDALFLASSCPWRDGATHVLIHVTDDTFVEAPQELSSDPVFGGGVRVQHTYAEVLAALRAKEVRVGAFFMQTPENCGAGTSGNTARGFSEAFNGMPALTSDSATGGTGGAFWDIRRVRDENFPMDTAIIEMIMSERCDPF